jgi:hypothetical protein
MEDINNSIQRFFCSVETKNGNSYAVVKLGPFPIEAMPSSDILALAHAIRSCFEERLHQMGYKPASVGNVN